MKKLFSLVLLAFAAMTFVSCEPEDKKKDDGKTPMATLNVDGRIVEYNFAYDFYAPIDETGQLYMHALTFSDVAVDDESDEAGNANVLAIVYVSDSKTLKAGEVLPASGDNMASALLEGKPLYVTMQAIGATDVAVDYMYLLIVSPEEATSDQPSISVVEKDGLYTMVFEDAVMTDENGSAKYNASFVMNGRIEFQETNFEDMGLSSLPKPVALPEF